MAKLRGKRGATATKQQSNVQRPGKRRFPGRKQRNNVQRLGRSIHKLVQEETGVASGSRNTRKVARIDKWKASQAENSLKRGYQSRFQAHSESVSNEDGRVERTGFPHRGSDKMQQQMEVKPPPSAEDREIKRLEDLLNMDKRKKKGTLPASFKAEGLDYVLGALDPAPNKDLEGSDDDPDTQWLKAKRIKSERKRKLPKELNVDVDAEEEDEDDDDIDDDGDDDDDETDEDGDLFEDSDSDGHLDSNDDADLDDFLASDSDDSTTKMDQRTGSHSSSHDSCRDEEQAVFDQLAALKKNRKRPQSSTTDSSSINPAKSDVLKKTTYVPPHKKAKDLAQMEKSQSDTRSDKHLQQLKRSVKGLVNRLSEATLPSVLSQLAVMYTRNSRNEMNGVLSEVVFQACVPPSLLPSKFALEHMALVAALSAKIGTEIGAHIVQELVVKFDQCLQLPDYGQGKEVDNVVQLVCHLYNFKVVHCLLIYDIIRKLIESFKERDIEILLLLLKSVGMAIRKDDPTALKDIVMQIQSKSGQHSSDSIRMTYMLDTIAALRTNNARKIPNYDPSQVVHTMKILRALLPPGSLGESTLKISLNDLLNASKQGRWWIVGSAWKQRETNQKGPKGTSEEEPESWVLELARKQRMNTDLRKRVFSVMITSEDYVDAFEKLQRLGLKEVQEREVIHVLVECCLREKEFNPYYAFLGQKLCEFKRTHQVTFQYTIWDRLKMLPDLSQTSLDNLWRLLSHLISSKALSLGLLRIVEFAEMDKVGLYFFRKLLGSLLWDHGEDVCIAVFSRILPLPNLKTLREALLLFLHHFLKSSSPSDLNKRIAIVEKVLKDRSRLD